MIHVVLAGASGRTGREVAKAAVRADDIEVVGAVGHASVGKDLGEVLGLGPLGVRIAHSPDALATGARTVWVDFTKAAPARVNVPKALRRGWPAVVGTTGLSAEDLAAFAQAAEDGAVGVAVVANFSLGAGLSARLAALAFDLFPHAEIIEQHGSHKLDRPSGTAAALASDLARRSPDRAQVPVHSVRLPGLVAHQEVLFGGAGETITIRHDVYGREAYAAGALAAIRHIGQVHGLVTDVADLWESAVGP